MTVWSCSTCAYLSSRSPNCKRSKWRVSHIFSLWHDSLYSCVFTMPRKVRLFNIIQCNVNVKIMWSLKLLIEETHVTVFSAIVRPEPLASSGAVLIKTCPGFPSQLLPSMPFPLTPLLTCHSFHLFCFYLAFKFPSAAVKRNKTDKSHPLHSDAEWKCAKRLQIQAMKLLYREGDDRCVDICCRIINEMGKN